MTMPRDTMGQPATTAPFPELSQAPLPGDANIFSDAISERNLRQGRREAAIEPRNVSVYTQVALELRDFTTQMREELKKDIPAPFMQRLMTRRQKQAAFLRMTPEQRTALTRRFGVRRIAELAQKLGIPEGHDAKRFDG